MNTIADVYQDYSELMKDIEETNENKETIYESIMKKEDNRINLLNRLMDHKQTSSEQNTFMNMSLTELFEKTVKIWWEIYGDIVYKSVTDPIALFWKGDRKIFIGILLVIIAIVLFFVNISG